MQVPTSRLFAAGDILSGAALNQAVTSFGNFFMGKPICILRQTVAQTMNIGVSTILTFTTEDIDRDNGHSNTTNTDRYTAQTPGYYRVTATCVWEATATGGSRQIEIMKNGGAVNGSFQRYYHTSVSSVTSISTSALVYLNGSTDYVSVEVAQTSTNLSTRVTAPEQSSMIIEWVSL